MAVVESSDDTPGTSGGGHEDGRVILRNGEILGDHMDDDRGES